MSDIAGAVFHVAQCSLRMQVHTGGPLRAGATATQMTEAIRVKAEIPAGAAFPHLALPLDPREPEEEGGGG